MTTDIRHNWSAADVEALYALPFPELMHQAQLMHRRYFNPVEIQTSTLLSIKTGACPEDCAYCPQSAHYDTDLSREELMDVNLVIAAAKKAKEQGASRFCMGAAWRTPPREKLFAKTLEMVEGVKALGLETCMTLGMLNKDMAERLKESGLDFYNHNLDTSPEYYQEIITTRCYQDRLDTLSHVRNADMKVCCGGILGMGETREDRIQLLLQLANLAEHPQSVPINRLIKIKGTPLENVDEMDVFEFVRSIAIARIMMPKSFVRLSAGRDSMSDEMQALCFLAGANSIFYGDTLLTAPNPKENEDHRLFERLGLQTMQTERCQEQPLSE